MIVLSNNETAMAYTELERLGILECVHMTSRQPNKETAAILEEWNILLGIKLYFYANPSFCFIMLIWLLVTCANTLYTNTGSFETEPVASEILN